MNFNGAPAPGIGNPYFLGGENNNLPFFVGSMKEYGQSAGAAMANGSHTIKITEEVKAYKKLDECYLPYGARTFVFTPSAAEMGNPQAIPKETTITSISFDEFAEILWNGGSMVIDMSKVFPLLHQTMTLRNNVAYWTYGQGQFNVVFPVSNTTTNGAITLEYATFTFTNGTWTPPTE